MPMTTTTRIICMVFAVVIMSQISFILLEEHNAGYVNLML